MDAPTLLLCVLGVISALLMLLERWTGAGAGPRAETRSRVTRVAPEPPRVDPLPKPARLRLAPKPARPIPAPKPIIMERIFRPPVIVVPAPPTPMPACMEIRSAPCGPQGTDGSSKPSAEIEEDEGDAPENV